MNPSLLASQGAVQTMEWHWIHAPGSLWSALVMIALAGGLLYLAVRTYARESSLAAFPARRRVLVSLRVLALLTLCVVLLGPARTPVSERTILPRLLFLVDRSQSMRVADSGPDGRTERLESVSRVLQQESLFTALSEQYQMQPYVFSGDVGRIGDPADAIAWVDALQPEGRASDIAAAIRESASESSGAAVAGVVLITDGRSTTGGDPLDEARRVGAPFLTIGVGREEAPANIALRRIEAPQTVFPGSSFDVLAQVESYGFDGQEVDLVLEVENDVSETRRFLLRDGRQEERFQISLSESGLQNISLRIEARESESSDEDNAAMATVEVVDRKTRVLLVAGQPSWDYRGLQLLLYRDPTIDLSVWQQGASSLPGQDGNTVLDTFPVDAAALSDFDVMLLLDPDMVQIPPGWWERLAGQVETGGAGLLHMAGPAFTPPGFQAGLLPESLAKVIPVERDPSATADSMRTDRFSQPWNVTVPALSSAHPLVRAGDGIVQDWSRLPALYWWYDGVRAKAAAEVLLAHEARPERPLMVAGRAGGGATVFIATGEFWRWRSRADAHYAAFWLRLTRHLASGRQGRGKQILQSDYPSYVPGQTVAFTAELFDEARQPLKQESLPLNITSGPEGLTETIDLQADPERPGRYSGQAIAGRPGQYLARLQIPGTGEPMALSTHFRVEAPTAEFLDVTLNRRLLDEMAMETGGTTLSLEALTAEKIVEELPDRRQTVTLRGRPDPVWDTPWLLVWICALLGTEWLLRRRWSMA